MQRNHWIWIGALLVLGCGGTVEVDTPSEDTSGDTSALDVNTEDTTAQDTTPVPDTLEPVDTAPDGPVVDSCEIRCAPWVDCGDGAMQACQRSCTRPELRACEDDCLVDATTCDEAETCLGVMPTLGAFTEGPYGIGNRDVAGPFELPTLDGPFVFQDVWNGGESFVFLMTQTGWEYGDQLWESGVWDWAKNRPTNAHFLFMVYPHKGPTDNLIDDALERITALKVRIDEKLAKIGLAYGKALECNARRHIHYVTTQAWDVGGWIQEKLAAKGVLGFAIDRFQKLRAVGLLSMVGGTPQFAHANYEPKHYNFEWEREQDLHKEGVTEVKLWSGEHIGGGSVIAELPSAEEMAAFDSFEIDLSSFCPGHEEENCGEWDTGASLSVTEHPAIAENAAAETPCQGHVPEHDGAEKMGACGDATPCKVNDDCGDGTPCAGYEPATEPTLEILADTLPCACIVPAGEPRDTVQTCKTDGLGYGACECNQSVEIARWITTYGREGRWISDQTPMLAMLKNGGPHRFSYSAGNTYNTFLSFRFFTKGDKDRPFKMVPLFNGGSFNPSYNSKYSPLELDIPAETTRVEILAYITGHGWGAEKANCAEFCNHTHHFTINDDTFMHEQPWVGNNYGCAMQVNHGTIPNQYGTWTLGRAGWCPGLDVKPYIVDVTAALKAGETTTISYQGLFDGTDYQPEPSGAGKGFGANIWMNSWLVFYK